MERQLTAARPHLVRWKMLGENCPATGKVRRPPFCTTRAATTLAPPAPPFTPRLPPHHPRLGRLC
eukprot:scaffold8100_cov117-Isochrysis_galbana.AAC.4